MEISSEVVITVLSALAAALSFAAFAYPFLKRGETKDRYKDVIEKRKKVL